MTGEYTGVTTLSSPFAPLCAATGGPGPRALHAVVGQNGAMDSTLPQLTGDLARAGRALAQISHFVVARQAGLDPDRFRSFERGTTDLEADELEAARHALEYYGVEFLPESVDEGIGYGVRRKFNQRTAKRIENWENEGGPAYEDDI